MDDIFSVGDKLLVKHVGEPDEVAEAYLFAMKCDRSFTYALIFHTHLNDILTGVHISLDRRSRLMEDVY